MIFSDPSFRKTKKNDFKLHSSTHYSGKNIFIQFFGETSDGVAMSLRKVSKESLDENKPCLGDEQEERCAGSPVQSTAEVGHGRDRVVDVVLAQEQAEVVAKLERGQL